MKPLTHAERQALGRNARKQLARSAHADFKVNICPADPLAILQESMRGRVARLVPIKYQRMEASAFGFFRGAVPIMAADLACHPKTGLTTQLCGDAHVENLGAFATLDNRIVFDLNDFDETIRGPFEWDVKRLATSILLAGREAGIRRADRDEAVATFTSRYRRLMGRFANMPVLELGRYQIHRLGHVGPMPAIFAQAERSTPQRLLEKLTEPVGAGTAAGEAVGKAGTASGVAGPLKKMGSGPRRFRSAPPLLERIVGAQARKILNSVPQYAKTLQPERQHFLAQYTAVDVAFKVVGTGSVGLRDYVVYMEGAGRPTHSDPLFLQIKEEPASAYARYIPDGAAGWTHQGHRVMDGQRAMQLTSDPFLGYTTIDNRDYLVRQLNDHKAALDLGTLTAANLHGYADLCGELLARGHARAGDPVSMYAYLGSSGRFDDAILAFARAYADKTERDWEALRRWMKTHPQKRVR
ncbi:MAG TPA: DUF2252 domain-containing protein [Acidobacteriaceae bacterium]|nr:DUF2252 domain-containing protein [Acidobacteriaceae bacterium]